MTRRIALYLLTAGCCALAAACLLGGCGGDEAPPPAGKPKRVALVMKSLANEFFKTMEEGARKHQQKDPTRYELISNGIKDERDVAAQVALVEQMIAQKVNALVIAPADSKALVPVCKKAKDAGIEVVNIDNKFDDEALDTVVDLIDLRALSGWDEYKAEIAARQPDVIGDAPEFLQAILLPGLRALGQRHEAGVLAQLGDVEGLVLDIDAMPRSDLLQP